MTTTITLYILIAGAAALLVALIYYRQKLENLKKSEAARQQSLTLVSHNLLTPLSRIKFAVSSLLGEAGALPADKQEIVSLLAKKILQDTDRLIHGTTVILEFSDLFSAKKASSFTLTEPSVIIQEMVKTFQPAMAEKNISFKVDLPPDNLPRLALGELYLRTVLEIFLDNAQIYTPIGGSVTFAVAPQGKDLVFSVADSGIGISAERLPHIFDRATPLTSEGKVRDSGMGLGLSVCKGVIERNGGKIWASSPGLGRGSTFSFSVPYITDPAALAAKA